MILFIPEGFDNQTNILYGKLTFLLDSLRDIKISMNNILYKNYLESNSKEIFSGCTKNFINNLSVLEHKIKNIEDYLNNVKINHQKSENVIEEIFDNFEN